KIGSDDTEVVKGSGDTEVLDIEKAVNTADEGMFFVQEKDAETQGKIGSDDTEVVKGSGD
ncbi:hypothetical protein Tco_0689079, partial [Tanacetum coccineum]